MIARVARELAAAACALTVLALVIAPAVILNRAAERGGIGRSWYAFDLLAVSAVVGVIYAVLVHRRLPTRSLSPRSRPAHPPVNTWIATAHAVVALAVLTPLLLAGVLYLLGPLRSPLGDHALGLLAVWAGVHLIAVGAAEWTGRLMFRWLSR